MIAQMRALSNSASVNFDASGRHDSTQARHTGTDQAEHLWTRNTARPAHSRPRLFGIHLPFDRNRTVDSAFLVVSDWLLDPRSARARDARRFHFRTLAKTQRNWNHNLLRTRPCLPPIARTRSRSPAPESVPDSLESPKNSVADERFLDVATGGVRFPCLLW